MTTWRYNIFLDSFLWQLESLSGDGSTMGARRCIDEFSNSTMSGLAGEVQILIGIVAGESGALHNGISANKDWQLWVILHEHKR